MSTIYDFTVRSIEGRDVALSEYRGKVLLIVNVASKCGFTPQYEGLEELYKHYESRGLEILGFPCNQFRAQEPGSEQEIQEFCRLTYGVTFPIFSKIEVNGSNTHPLYRFLKQQRKGFLGSEAIKWNFTKFLVDKAGNVIERFSPQTKPQALAEKIAALV